MNLIKLKRNTNENNKDFVYRTLYQSILYNKLSPNDIVSETELQAYFEMSRSPIREALSILIHLGLLEVNPHRYTVVSPLNEHTISDTAFLRISVDKFALEKCIQIEDISPLVHELDSILSKVLEYEGETETDYIQKIYIDIDTKFHDIIYRYAGFVELTNILTNVNTHYSRFNMLYLEEWLSTDVFFNNHKAIINLIKTRDNKAIDEYYNNSLDSFINNISNIKEKYPGYFINNNH